MSEFAIPPRPIQYDILPAKLQARGDAIDSGNFLSRSAMGGRARDGRPSTPSRALSSSASRAEGVLPPSARGSSSDLLQDSDTDTLSRLPGTPTEGGSFTGIPVTGTGPSAPAGSNSKRLRLLGDDPPEILHRGSVSSAGSDGTSRADSSSLGRSARHGTSGDSARRPSLASSTTKTFSDKRFRAANPHMAAGAGSFWNFNGGSDKNGSGTEGAGVAAPRKTSSPAGSLRSRTSLGSGLLPPGRASLSAASGVAGVPSGLTAGIRSNGSTSTYPSNYGASSTYSFPDRKVSVAPTAGGRGTGGAAGSAGAWQAPDSWAVKPDGAASFDSDSDEASSDRHDDDADDDLYADHEFDSEESALGTRDSFVPLSGSAADSRASGTLDGDTQKALARSGRPSTGGSRTSARHVRPGTADNEGRKASQKPVRAKLLSLTGSRLQC